MQGSFLDVYTASYVYLKGTYPESCVVELCHTLSGTDEWLYVCYCYILQGSFAKMHGSFLDVYTAFRSYGKGTYPESFVVES